MTRKEVRVTLEAVTPLLLHGADSGEPELRPPSFRGAMRYWWRAALGGIIGDEDVDVLHRLESKVFGDTSRGSAVTVRLGARDVRTSRTHLLPHKHRVSRNGLVGRFELILSQPRGDDGRGLESALASLRLALTLGGVGQRSRRGFGTLRVVRTRNGGLRAFPRSRRGWRQHIVAATQRAIDAAARLAVVENIDLARPADVARFPCATDRAMIRLCPVEARSAMDAVTTFMRRVENRRALGGIRPRQASPLWVRPIQTGSAQYDLLCSVLPSDFRYADYDYVREFLDRFDGEYIDVRGWNTL